MHDVPTTAGAYTRHALRVAAASLSLVLAECWHLKYGFQAVLTTHMVLAIYAFTAFQKGVERIAGRGCGSGILLGREGQSQPSGPRGGTSGFVAPRVQVGH